MRAVLVNELGTPPALGEAAEPEPQRGEALLEVVAAPLNPVDISVASGKFFAGSPIQRSNPATRKNRMPRPSTLAETSTARPV